MADRIPVERKPPVVLFDPDTVEQGEVTGKTPADYYRELFARGATVDAKASFEADEAILVIVETDTPKPPAKH